MTHDEVKAMITASIHASFPNLTTEELVEGGLVDIFAFNEETEMDLVDHLNEKLDLNINYWNDWLDEVTTIDEGVDYIMNLLEKKGGGENELKKGQNNG